jgi:hypothetical protein
MMKKLGFVFSLVLLAGGPSLRANQTPQSAGPVTTDAEIVAELDLKAPGMETVSAAVQSENLSFIQRAYLEYRRSASPARWGIMPSDQQASAVAQDDPIGDEISRHYIRNFFYNFKPTAADMGRDFDWTYNPVPKNDPSFTNEWTWCAISRTQFWDKLADAYWKTRNEKYAREWVSELEDFTVKNPMNHDGANGKPPLWRTLDASIRMSDSWPYSYYHYLNSPSFTPEAHWIYVRMARDHALLLVNGLRDPQRTGNWVTSECFGLYTLGSLFPELKDAATWRQIAIDRLMLELNRMVPPDGFEAELTPSYHMVALDGFLGPVKLARLNNMSLPDEFQTKILSMYRAVVMVMDQNGDDVSTNDSGPTNAFKTSKGGLKFIDDPLLQWAASGATSGAGLPDSTMLPYAGFYALRSGWKLDDLFLFFRAGPTGIGHQHEDMLEIVLRAWNKTLLFDPGNYVYDHSDWRRFAIGTASHSTIIMDGKWQHRGHSSAPVDAPVNNPWVTTPLFDFVAGTYSGGYQMSVYNPQKEFQPQSWAGDLDRSVTHTRRVLFLRPYYALLLDTLDGSGNHTFDAHFHLDAPSARLDQSTQAAFSQNDGDVQLALYPLERSHLNVDIVKGQQDPLLGWMPDQHRPIPTVRFRKQQDAPAMFATFLYPYKGEAPAFHSKSLNVNGAGAWGQALNTPREKAEIVLVKDGTSQDFSFRSDLAGQVKAKAMSLVVRQPAGTSELFAGGWGLLSFSDEKTQFSLNVPGTVLIASKGNHSLLFNGGSAPLVVSFTRPFAQTATLAPGTWTEVGGDGGHPATAPKMFDPFVP